MKRTLLLLLAAAGAWPAAAAGPPARDGFVAIRPGTFLMGSPADEPGRFHDETLHRVTLTRAFELCDHLVTQAEWRAVMGWDDSHFAGRADHPVEHVTWFDCIDYCNRRSRLDHRAPAYTLADVERDSLHIVSAVVSWDREAAGYRLPTEAEWEYACRAGTTTAYSNGPITTREPGRCSIDSCLALIGWYCANSGRQTHPVNRKPPNRWGLYDMAGNVQEWVWDEHADFTDAAASDPTGPPTGGLKVWRGGGWDYDPRHCRAADRGADGPEGRFRDVGLRVARSVMRR